jgi:hypothetical protein
MDSIRFDVYGRFEVVVTPTENGRRVTRSSGDKRSLDVELLDGGVTEDDLADRIEILWHEFGSPGARIRRIP